MDRLSPFFSHFSLSAKVFFSGRLCGTSTDHETTTAGHLHVLRSGTLKILQPSGPPISVREPSVLLYPRPQRHTFASSGAEVLCAYVEFGSGMLNPLVALLPQLLIVPLATVPELEPTAKLLFFEAFSLHDGRQPALDRLAEYFLILLLRFAAVSPSKQADALLALADKHLSKAFDAMHQQPERAWTLEQLAHIAGMSRSRFSSHFLATTGQTPFGYLALWRIGVAQSLLKKGTPLKIVASAVGFASPEALTRSFSLHLGMPPIAWLSSQQKQLNNPRL